MTDLEHDLEQGLNLDQNLDDGLTIDDSWTEVCPMERLPIDRGVAAIVGGEQVAVFRLAAIEPGDGHAPPSEELVAVSHVDPVTGSPVIARGLVGSVGAPPLVIPTVASPLHKQRYNLRSGVCLDDSTLALQVFQVTVADGIVFVRQRPRRN